MADGGAAAAVGEVRTLAQYAIARQVPKMAKSSRITVT